MSKFNVQRRDYPSFKRDWVATITGKFDAEHELREIHDRVPKEVRPDMKNLKSMTAVWAFLDK